MSIFFVAKDRPPISVVGICSNPAGVPVNVFYDLISLSNQFQKDSALLNDAFNLDNECKSTLQRCETGDGPWHPKPKIEKYLESVKKKYAVQRQEGIAREEGPIGGKILFGGKVLVRGEGPVEGKVLVKEEDTAAKEDILVSVGADLYAGGGAKAVFIFRHMYDYVDARKKLKWFNATRAWPSKLREASGKRLSQLESDPKIEAWCDADSRYCKLKEGTIGVDQTPCQSKDTTDLSNSQLDEVGNSDRSRPSQSKDATDSSHPQHNEAGDSGYLRPPKRMREDSSDGQHEDGEQLTNTPSSDHTQASLGLRVQQEARRVETDMITDPKQNRIQPQPPHQQPPQDPSRRQSPKPQPPSSSGNTPKGPPLAFLKNAVPNPFLPENKGKPTAWSLSMENLCCVLQKLLGGYEWFIHELPQKGVCITTGKGLDLILERHSPMNLARWEKGPEATYEDLLALSLTTERLCTYMSRCLGSTTDLDILCISGVPQILFPLGMEGVFLFSKNAFVITGREADAIIDAKKSQASIVREDESY